MYSKEVYIRMRNGNKETELRLSNICPEHQLAMIDGMFKFFELDVDFKEMADIYNRSAKAYQEFFAQLDSEENGTKTDQIKMKHHDPKSEYNSIPPRKENIKKIVDKHVTGPSKVSKPNSNDSNSFIRTSDYSNDYFITGVKLSRNKEVLYRCRYKCDCGDESNHYIKIGTMSVPCWKCSKRLEVSPATQFGEPEEGKNREMYRDSYGNFYIAGKFERNVLTLSDRDKE
ncbi:hypothetical protein [Bacillus swezeyi]|uniref:Uncharacterized protein n=1 Tax=Bacillus swezeyi TaxID=1925020 RepID=A0A5M8REJ1_9BACI|nr:hypothetical protein [Bacillus swezeyi]KAA6447005.1 hypothetical protein DX927_23470 [Bacillus swezeyi]KAA6471573.1 hypothetical protein DX928_23710 [Bacillus swezeyi]